MYDLNDTIVAVSSPTSEQRAIVRISGPDTIDVLQQIFSPSISGESSALIPGSVAIDPELRIDAKLYLFLAPRSYTGDDVAEIHIYANHSVAEALMGNLLSSTGVPVRMAGPGEFTARAYLNGKMDLTQAEAVNEIVVSSNKFQLAASEKLLAGRLGETTAKVRTEIMDCLSLIEAGLDFSQEDIEFITRPDAVERLAEIKQRLQQLLSGSISYESVIDLPSVGIAGAPNAGKSSLLNKLLGLPRSIVSDQHKTTRDVLTGMLTLRHCRCVLFDCAGLTRDSSLVARRSGHGSRVTGHESRTILDELAQQAAAEALRNSSVVVFCIDISKGFPFCNKSQKGAQTDYSEDIAIRELIEPKVLIPVATKSDLLTKDMLAERISRLNELFTAEFIPASAKTGIGVELLKDAIDRRLIELAVGGTRPNARYEIRDTRYDIALTARHRQAVIEAIEGVSESIGELKAGQTEVTAMMLRAAYQSLSTIEAQSIDEEILERIFSRFCIGK